MKAAIVLAALAWTLPLQAKILDLHVDVRIAKSGELTVTERLTLREEKDATGFSRERQMPSGARVVEEARRGRLYQVTYRVARQVRFLEAHDELRWRIDAADRITAEVWLPEGVPARGIRAEAAGRDWQVFVREGRAGFRARETLALTVRFPKGVVTEPRLSERARWLVADYLGLLLVLAGLCLTAATLLHLRKVAARS
jgi:hypothetical protein